MRGGLGIRPLWPVSGIVVHSMGNYVEPATDKAIRRRLLAGEAVRSIRDALGVSIGTVQYRRAELIAEGKLPARNADKPPARLRTLASDD